MKTTTQILLKTIASLGALLACATLAHAEPYLAVREGYKCAQCHVNPTGGGLRTLFGNAYAQTRLAATALDTGGTAWTGSVSQWISMGADLRANANMVQIRDKPHTREFALDQVRLYINADIIPQRLNVYVDELVAPGAASNQEAYVRYSGSKHNWSIKAGQMYLPFGFRLQDSSAFVRQLSGINMDAPDTGVELTWEPGKWSTQLAITNGSAGAAENNTGKQYSAQAAYIAQQWRVGAAGNFNDSETGDRSVMGLFTGITTGPIAWLGEINYAIDKGLAGGNRKLIAGLLEANVLVRQGHNLKVTAEQYDPDREVSHDMQVRYSTVYEYTPIQFLQLRTGIRYYDGIPQNALQNRRVLFLEAHGFF